MNGFIRGGFSVTAEQDAVVNHVLQNDVTVVIAGAGSGKTYTTVAAVMELIEQSRASIEEFVLITFTRKAAEELRQRVERAVRMHVENAATRPDLDFWMAQEEKMAAAYIGTIHGFCRDVLQTFGYEERIAREAGITFSNYIRDQAIKDAVEAYARQTSALLLTPPPNSQEYDLRALVDTILEHIRSHDFDPLQVRRETIAQSRDDRHPYRTAMAAVVAKAAELYEQRKSESQVLDSQDLLTRTASLLSGPNASRIRNLIGARRRYLFVDEFQDTDKVQKNIIDALIGTLCLLVVGDRKQSIYSFRAGDDLLLEQIAQENGVLALPINISRRPTFELLQTQNAFVASLGLTYPLLAQPLSPALGTVQTQSGLPPFIWARAGARDRTSSIAATARMIRGLLTRRLDDTRALGNPVRQIEPGDIAILVRSNNQLQEYQAELPRLLPGVEVRSDEGGRFFQQPEILSAYHMLRLLLHYPDDTVLSLALHTPYFAGVDPAAHELYIVQYRVTTGAPLTDWFEANYPQYHENLEKLRAAVRTANVPELLLRLYELFDIHQYYLARGDQQAVDNLEKLRELARTMFANQQALTLSEFVQRMQRDLLTSRDESEALSTVQQPDQRPPYIRISTIHKAKGLEFPIVIIPELQTPVLNKDNDPKFLVGPGWGLDLNLNKYGRDTRSPDFDSRIASVSQARLEEEMRLLYVAVTRAQNAVVFVSDAPRRSANAPGSTYYAWKDEVLTAWPDIAQLGGRAVDMT